jgi:hypothetical protein
MVVVEGHRHAVIGEQQEGQGAALDLVLGDQMAHEGLEEGLVRDPCGAEKAQHVGAIAQEGQDLFDRVAAQAPPLAADLHLDVVRDPALQPQPPLRPQRPIEQPLVLSLIQVVAIGQPVLLQPGLDPVRGEEIDAFDIVHIRAIKEVMRVFGRFDDHAIARQHVEMRGVGEGFDRRLDRVQRRLDQAPFAPAATHPLAREGDAGIALQRGADAGVILSGGAGVEMDRHAIAGRRQPFGLGDDPVGILVAQQYEGDLRHRGDPAPRPCPAQGRSGADLLPHSFPKIAASIVEMTGLV